MPAATKGPTVAMPTLIGRGKGVAVTEDVVPSEDADGEGVAAEMGDFMDDKALASSDDD